MATLPTVRTARNAMRDRLGEWLASLEFTPLDDDADPYSLTSVASRAPKQGEIVTYPSAVIVMGQTTITRRQGTEEVRGSRAPVEGEGEAIERLGTASAQAAIVIYAADEESEDEIVGTITEAMWPVDGLVARLDLACEDHHGVILTLRPSTVGDMTAGQVQDGVWQPTIQVTLEMPLVRSIDAADFQPHIELDVEHDIILDLDIVEGETDDITDD